MKKTTYDQKIKSIQNHSIFFHRTGMNQLFQMKMKGCLLVIFFTRTKNNTWKIRLKNMKYKIDSFILKSYLLD